MTKMNRRHFLAGLGAGAAALPLLSRLPSAHAQAFPTRFVVFFTPNEPIDPSYWEPGSGFSLTDVMQPLTQHKDKLLMIGHMKMETRDKDNFGGGHVGMGHLLTGEVNNPYGSGNPEFWAGGISVDQLIANELNVEAMTVAARPGGANGNTRISYSGANNPVHPIEDPLKAFDTFLGDYTIPVDDLAELRAQKRTVLDAVAGQLDRLKGKIAKADRGKLQLHLDRVRDIEASLTGNTTVSCSPTAPAGGFDYKANSDYPITGRRHMDVVAQALACDATRVATIQLGNSGGSNLTPSWPSYGIDSQTDEHNIAHNYNSNPSNANVNTRVALERFYYDQFAYFLDQLDSYEEGNGTLLDNTLVLWGKPIGRNHRGDDLLFMLAGGAGGQVQGGRYIERRDVPHNNLLTTCCQLMGLSQVTDFGDAEISSGPVSL